MVISRRRIAAVLSGSVLVGTGLFGGVFQAATATAAGDTAACIAALRADRTESQRISNEWVANFNATGAGSALSKYDAAYIKALKESRDDYFKAYSYAFKGMKTTANTWVAKGNAAIARANTYVAKYNTEIARIDGVTNQINADADKLNAQMDATDQTCAGL